MSLVCSLGRGDTLCYQLSDSWDRVHWFRGSFPWSPQELNVVGSAWSTQFHLSDPTRAGGAVWDLTLMASLPWCSLRTPQPGPALRPWATAWP